MGVNSASQVENTPATPNMMQMNYAMPNQMQHMQGQMMVTVPMTVALNATMNGIVTAINQSVEPLPNANRDAQLQNGFTKGGLVGDDGDDQEDDGYDEHTDADTSEEDANDYDPMYNKEIRKENNNV